MVGQDRESMPMAEICKEKTMNSQKKDIGEFIFCFFVANFIPLAMWILCSPAWDEVEKPKYTSSQQAGT